MERPVIKIKPHIFESHLAYWHFVKMLRTDGEEPLPVLPDEIQKNQIRCEPETWFHLAAVCEFDNCGMSGKLFETVKKMKSRPFNITFRKEDDCIVFFAYVGAIPNDAPMCPGYHNDESIIISKSGVNYDPERPVKFGAEAFRSIMYILQEVAGNLVDNLNNDPWRQFNYVVDTDYLVYTMGLFEITSEIQMIPKYLDFMKQQNDTDEEKEATK